MFDTRDIPLRPAAVGHGHIGIVLESEKDRCQVRTSGRIGNGQAGQGKPSGPSGRRVVVVVVARISPNQGRGILCHHRETGRGGGDWRDVASSGPGGSINHSINQSS